MNVGERADRFIPAGTQTYSKARSQFPAIAPRFAFEGQGARVLCSDGRWYTDWTAALGPIVLGYRHPIVQAAVHKAVDDGPIFGLPTELEGEVAELLVGIVPCAERVRFGKNGSDVTNAAVRAARALTGRDVVVSDGYHGWTVACPNPNGMPLAELALVRPVTAGFGGVDMRTVAAVIVEPDVIQRRDPDSLTWLRAQCDTAGTLLIFDEVLTGFRLALGGAQAHFGVTPDLACFAKSMANGYSCSAVVGTKAAMQPFAGGIGYSTTFGGETIGLAAAAATIRVLRSEPVIEHLWEIGHRLQDGWNALAKAHGLDLPCEGLPPRTVIRYPSLAHKTLITQEMFRRGQLFTVGFTPTYAHQLEHVDAALLAADAAMHVLASCDDPRERIEGPLIAPVYRKP